MIIDMNKYRKKGGNNGGDDGGDDGDYDDTDFSIDDIFGLLDPSRFIVKLGMEKIKALFIDQYNEPQAQIMTNHGYIICSIKGHEFRMLLNELYFIKEGEGCKPADLNEAILTFAAKAMFAGAGQFELHPRLAWRNGTIFYDLCDLSRGVVKILPYRWSITRDVPILFRRYPNQAFQVSPVRGGDAAKILEYINVANPHTKLLILVWLVASFIPEFPHPLLILHGSQGAAKTSCCRKLKRIIDPGQRSVESMPKSARDLSICLHNQWLSAFDNLHMLSPLQSDGLCRAVTGDAFTTRALYTNGDEFLLRFQRVVIINGIELCAVLPDIIDRSIIIHLERIAMENRKTDEQLDAQFMADLPSILGGIFDVISRAIAIYPEAKKRLINLPRMADFATWGYAIGEALGGRGQDFLEAYSTNITSQNEEVVVSNPISEAIMHFMADRTTWAGTPTNLHRQLTGVAVEHHINTKTRSWPDQSSVLTKQIKALQTNLFDLGIQVEFSRSNMNRRITITKNPFRTMKSITSVAPIPIPPQGEDETSSYSSAIDDGMDWYSDFMKIGGCDGCDSMLFPFVDYEDIMTDISPSKTCDMQLEDSAE